MLIVSENSAVFPKGVLVPTLNHQIVCFDATDSFFKVNFHSF